MNFGELQNDPAFAHCVEGLENHLQKIEEAIAAAVEFKEPQELPTLDKVKLDSYLAYCVNSLYWVYLKVQGEYPNEHNIKNELMRVKAAMEREKVINDREHRPMVDQAAAERFVKRSLQLRDKDDDENEVAPPPKQFKS